MGSNKLSRLNFSFSTRNAPYRGPSPSETFNDTVEEIAADLARLTDEWNTKLLKLVDTIPDGSDDSSVDAFRQGLDGDTLYVDSDLTSSSEDTTYYNSTSSRPQTIKEAFDSARALVDTQITTVRNELAAATAPLTDTQKERIGSNVFNSSASSSADSLDGKSENNRLNLIQVAKDFYGSSFTLDNDGNANLGTYNLQEMVQALLVLHSGDWNTDITLNHSGITGPWAQTSVLASSSINDSYVGTPSTAQDDLNQIRTRIKTIAGTTAWTTSLPALYTSGPDSLKDLLDSTAGTGTKSSTNPWGYLWSDVEGLQAIVEAVRDFTGQDTTTDTSPTYSSTIYVNDGQPLEFAIGILDDALSTLSGLADTPVTNLASFVGQDTPAQSYPTYASINYVTQNANLETAVGELDNALASGIPVIPPNGGGLTGATVATVGAVHRLDVTASGYNIELPTVSGSQGKSVWFKRQTGNSGEVSIRPQIGNTVEQGSLYVMSGLHDKLQLMSDGISDWMVL